MNGRRLRPFSSWHKLQLEYANSPFLAGGDVSAVDIEVAVGVCRTGYPDFFVYDAPAAGIRKWMWVLRAERMDVRKEQQAFESYLADYMSGPKLWETPKKKGQAPARRDVDDSISDVSLYLSSYGGTRPAAWDLAIGELLWMNVCAAKQGGSDVRVWTPGDERAFREHLKTREETLARLAEEFAAKEGLSPDEAKKRAHTHYWAVVKRNKAKGGF